MKTQPNTWAEDFARGLNHPDSAAARQEHAQARSDAQAGRWNTLTHALYLLGRSVRTDADVVQTIRCMLAGLLAQNPLAGSREAATIAALSALADEIEEGQP